MDAFLVVLGMVGTSLCLAMGLEALLLDERNPHFPLSEGFERGVAWARSLDWGWKRGARTRRFLIHHVYGGPRDGCMPGTDCMGCLGDIRECEN